MKYFKYKILFVVYFFALLSINIYAQDKEITVALKSYFSTYQAEGFFHHILPISLTQVKVDEHERKIHIYGNEGFSSQLFTPQIVNKIYDDIKSILPATYKDYSIAVYAFEKEISTLIPNLYSNNKQPERLFNNIEYHGRPWTFNASRPVIFSKGLQNRHISICPSHGRYYMYAREAWAWQRPYLFCTTEDMFTLSFVTPYLIPMLENSGAVVFTSRERDWQTNEVIVDNDAISQGDYNEENKKETWKISDVKGYAKKKDIYFTNENPFIDGTARCIPTVSQVAKSSSAKWIPNIPEEGKYAVYVSYQTLPDNVDDAHYTIVHKGIETNILVNQKIGGGTWVYLGTYEFDRENPENNYVSLSNLSKKRGKISADAVRFGGGMGNVARGDIGKEICSNLPRFLEGVRYSAQMSGFPDSTYDVKGGFDDYGDDLNSRSRVLNCLASGSVYLPSDSKKTGIPIELSVAVHSDAGAKADNSTYGTLNIYTQHNDSGNTVYPSGLTRMVSSDLAQVIQNTVCSDLTNTLGITWPRREVLNRNYNESRVPDIPSTIIETLSHQNFMDLRLGHDPNFKFLMARSIYKGIAQFICNQHKQECVIHPLPVQAIACSFREDGSLLLSWNEPVDVLESTAKPDGYIVYIRKEGEDYDNGTIINSNQCEIDIDSDVIYSFKVTAYNKGGESFPSEELSAMKASDSNKEILIVNAFNRLSGPAIIDTPDSLGFDLNKDIGVAYMKTPEYCGNQINYDRNAWGKEGGNALGYCGTELQGKIIAGNSFNYPYIHGKAIQFCKNCSFVSCNVAALQNNMVNLNDYSMVDCLLGLQKDDGASSIYAYKSFPLSFQKQLEDYSLQGGKLLVSGSYIASDMSTDEEKDFTSRVLHYVTTKESYTGNESVITSNAFNFNIIRNLGSRQYAVTHPDVLCPTNGAFCAFTYADGSSAGTAYTDGTSKVIALGFPFESIEDEQKRAEMMQAITQMMFIP